jgi:hypothetical protein
LYRLKLRATYHLIILMETRTILIFVRTLNEVIKGVLIEFLLARIDMVDKFRFQDVLRETWTLLFKYKVLASIK